MFQVESYGEVRERRIHPNSPLGIDCRNGNRNAVVKCALEWDLSKPIAYLTDRQGQDKSRVLRMADEYRRFIGIIADSPNSSFPVSEAVDEMWHTHLLFTRDYQQMGEMVRGGFIDHHPVLSEEERGKIIPHYLEGTLKNYERLYGEKPPLDWWPLEGAICWSKGPGLDA